VNSALSMGIHRSQLLLWERMVSLLCGTIVVTLCSLGVAHTSEMVTAPTCNTLCQIGVQSNVSICYKTSCTT
jgi:hypothetical protein